VTRALVLVHDKVPGRGVDEIGTVGPALHRLGFDMVVATFVSGPRPMPPPDRIALVVVLGSEAAAYDDTLPWLAPELAYLRAAIDAGIPVLGICFGAQALARVLGGTVGQAVAPELGFVTLDTADPDALPAGSWLEFHYDAFTLPPGATLLAANATGVQAFARGPHLGVQFHPEITPEVLAAWVHSWVEAGVWEYVDDSVDLTALAAEVADRATACAADCHELVELFCRRAGLVSSSPTR
jgi:GMP synthase (glutamine-hydrolysing)